MEWHIVFLGGLGLLILLVAWFPILARNLPISLPIVCMSIGFGIFSLIGEAGLNPRDYPQILEMMTEVTVIVSLAGAGLSIDQRLVWREWMSTTRLLGITMPLTILAVSVLAAFFLGLPWATAILIGAVIAPTDPVLAADVRVGPPRAGPSDEVRFSLTSEAGLNDGLAFPFVYLALGIAAHETLVGTWSWHWLAVDVIWRVAAGVAAGWLIGKLFGIIIFRMGKMAIAQSGHGFASLGGTFVAYAGAEMIQGYGFIAVFVGALMLRVHEDHYDYHHHLHSFTEQIERLLMMMLLVLFGGSLAGPAFESLTWEMAIGAIVVLFAIRPVAGMIGLFNIRMPRRERIIVSLFGIRGIGSFYYLAYATNEGSFAQIDVAWSFVSLIVVISIVLHGIASSPLMRWLDRKRDADA